MENLAIAGLTLVITITVSIAAAFKYSQSREDRILEAMEKLKQQLDSKIDTRVSELYSHTGNIDALLKEKIETVTEKQDKIKENYISRFEQMFQLMAFLRTTIETGFAEIRSDARHLSEKVEEKFHTLQNKS